MHSVVSVKKPTVRAMMKLLSDRHQIGRDLGEAALAYVQVERERSELVDDGNSRRILSHVDGDDVTSTRFAGVRAEMWESLSIRKNRQLIARLLATGGARHALMDPALAASAAFQHSRSAHQRLARLDQV